MICCLIPQIHLFDLQPHTTHAPYTPAIRAKLKKRWATFVSASLLCWAIATAATAVPSPLIHPETRVQNEVDGLSSIMCVEHIEIQSKASVPHNSNGRRKCILLPLPLFLLLIPFHTQLNSLLLTYNWSQAWFPHAKTCFLFGLVLIIWTQQWEFVVLLAMPVIRRTMENLSLLFFHVLAFVFARLPICRHIGRFISPWRSYNSKNRFAHTQTIIESWCRIKAALLPLSAEVVGRL